MWLAKIFLFICLSMIAFYHSAGIDSLLSPENSLYALDFSFYSCHPNTCFPSSIFTTGFFASLENIGLGFFFFFIMNPILFHSDHFANLLVLFSETFFHFDVCEFNRNILCSVTMLSIKYEDYWCSAVAISVDCHIPSSPTMNYW